MLALYLQHIRAQDQIHTPSNPQPARMINPRHLALALPLFLVAGLNAQDCNNAEKCKADMAQEDQTGPVACPAPKEAATLSHSINYDSGDCDESSVGEPPVTTCIEDQGCTFTVTITYAGMPESATLGKCQFPTGGGTRLCEDPWPSISGSGSATQTVNSSCGAAGINILTVVNGSPCGILSVRTSV
jgi:hypothetical protein